MKKYLIFILSLFLLNFAYGNECDDATKARMIKQGLSDEVIEKECSKATIKNNESSEEKSFSERVSKKNKKRGKIAWTFRNCGIGAMIFDTEPVFAAISNVTWDSGTSASSSSSTSPDSCEGEERMASIKYAIENYAILIEETSKGHSEFSIAYAGLLGCKIEGRELVTKTFRKNYLNDHLNSKSKSLDKSFDLLMDYEEIVSNENKCS